MTFVSLRPTKFQDRMKHESCSQRVVVGLLEPYCDCLKIPLSFPDSDSRQATLRQATTENTSAFADYGSSDRRHNFLKLTLIFDRHKTIEFCRGNLYLCLTYFNFSYTLNYMIPLRPTYSNCTSLREIDNLLLNGDFGGYIMFSEDFIFFCKKRYLRTENDSFGLTVKWVLWVPEAFSVARKEILRLAFAAQ